MPQIELSIEKKELTTEITDVLVAMLMDKGFECFNEDDSVLRAYGKGDNLASEIPDIMQSLPKFTDHDYVFSFRILKEKNWNEQWEKNFSPIVVRDRILIKAPFHNIPDLEYTVIIEPKMSFGTGHHETTRLMLTEMLESDLIGKEVLDMGCGTGVLGIMAKKMGAAYVLAVDNDKWAYYNSVENFNKNNIEEPFDVFPGERDVLDGHTFHFILANINRNILLSDLPVYFQSLKDNGILILSGILSSDKDAILEKAKECGFTFVSSFYENNWISLNLRK